MISDHTLLFGRQELSTLEDVCDLSARGDGEVDACLEWGRLDLGERQSVKMPLEAEMMLL